MAYEPAPLPSLSLVGGFGSVGGLTHPILTAESGTYALSGQTTQVFKGRRLIADQGTYAIAGQAGYADYHVVASSGAFSVSSFAVGLTASQRAIAAGTGTYTLTGQAVNLVAVDRVLTLLADPGAYSISTFTVGLIVPTVLTGNKVKLRTFVYSQPATATSAVSFDAQPIISSSTPDVFFLQGTPDSEDVSSYATGSGTLFYTVASGALGTDVNLSNAGLLTYGGTGGPSVSRITIRSDAVVAGARFEFAEIPELAFIEGIAETEELGVYQLDPTNRWRPGDITNEDGWQPATTCQLKSGTAEVGDAWLSYNASTGRLTYTGEPITGATRDYTVYLDTGTQQSTTFRIRILRPNYAYGFGTEPADKIAEHGWSGATAINAATVGFSQVGAGPVRINTALYGRTDAAPRVIYLCGQDFPHSYTPPGGSSTAQNWACSLGNKVGANETSWLYVLGDPDRRPHIFKTGGVQGRFQMRWESTIWTLKNLDLDHIGIFETTLTSNRKHKTILHKIKQINANSQGNGNDAIGSSFDYAPFAFPSADRIDATDGSLGTYFHTYITFFEGLRNGGQGLQHQMYAEGNGTSATFVNASLFAGAQASSTLKTIQASLKVRNSLLSVAPDFDTFASATDDAELWAQELLDVKSSTLLVDYNNDFRIGRVGTSGKGSRQFIFRRKRRTAFGADTPPYPEVNWNPPIGPAGHQPIPNFSDDAETFADDAYWAAVAATDILSPDNPYSFKHYHSFSTVRHLSGTPGDPLRDDGTHPTEAVVQGGSSVVLGTHLDWIERNVSFMSNMTYQGCSASYELDDSDAVAGTEDGTGSAARSYAVTWTNGTQGYIRVNQVNQKVASWSASLNSLITSLRSPPYTALDPAPFSVVQPNLVAQTAQPLYPPAKFQLGTITTRPELYPKVVEVTEAELPPWFEI